MNKAPSINLPYLAIAMYLLLAAGCLLVSDRLIVSLIESVRVIGLSGEIDKGQSAVESEVKKLQEEVTRADSVVAILADRRLPTLQDLKDLQRRHHLSLVQMERISKPGDGNPQTLVYNTVLSGSIGNLIRFLQELESLYIVQSEQVLFRPANENGSIVAMGLALTVREE